MKKSFILLSVLVVLIGVSACGTANSTATSPAAVPVANKVTASGNLFPNQYMYLTFLVRGRVATIPVKVGDDVKQGDVLMTLGDTAQAEAALAAANAEFLSAQQDYDTLVRTAGLCAGTGLAGMVECSRSTPGGRTCLGETGSDSHLR